MLFTGSAAFRNYCQIVDYSTDDYRDSLDLQVGLEPVPPSGVRMIQYLADGWTLEAIGEEVGLSPYSVKNRITYARERLATKTRPGMIYIALMLGLVTVTYPNGSRGLSTGSISQALEIPAADLSPPMAGVLFLLAMGLMPHEIQRVGGHSKATYITYAQQLRDRLEAPTNESAIRRGYEVGLLDPHNGGPPPVWVDESIARDPALDPGADPRRVLGGTILDYSAPLEWPPRGTARIPD